MLPDSLRGPVEALIGKKDPDGAAIIGTSAVGGGCIHQALKLKTHLGNFFLKHNRGADYAAMFRSEARGLELLRKAAALFVPEVLGAGSSECGRHHFLLLQWIEQAAVSAGFWESFGTGLAALHANKSEAFGLDHDNYIGSLPQENTPLGAPGSAAALSWADFFMLRRMEPMLKPAIDSGRAPASLAKGFERLYPRLNDFFPPEAPSLLHGDLWSGNYMVNQQGMPALIDPAVYYGHPYMDLGMSRLFGGFSEAFYKSYHSIRPPESNWQQGLDIANLYPLMVHVNLFGESYLSGVQAVLRKL